MCVAPQGRPSQQTKLRPKSRSLIAVIVACAKTTQHHGCASHRRSSPGPEGSLGPSGVVISMPRQRSPGRGRSRGKGSLRDQASVRGSVLATIRHVAYCSHRGRVLWSERQRAMPRSPEPRLESFHETEPEPWLENAASSRAAAGIGSLRHLRGRLGSSKEQRAAEEALSER